MATPLAPKDLVTLEELALSNMWEVAALNEVLEKKGLLRKGMGRSKASLRSSSPGNPINDVRDEH